MKRARSLSPLALVLVGVGVVLPVVTVGASVAAAATSTETIVGTATITGAPKGWEPDNFYTFFCPASETFSMDCPGQVGGTPNQTTGKYSTKVPAKAWKLGMYYYTANGQIIPSKAVWMPARPGTTIHASVSMAYVVPAASGKVAITGAPKNFGNETYMGVQACPSTAKFTVGCPQGQEAYEDIGPGSTYIIDLSPGKWAITDYCRTDNNLHTFAGTPVRFTAVYGSTLRVNVTMPYQGLG